MAKKIARRNIFANQIDCLQQGCIFNGAKLKGYEGCEAFGLIVTPRCDIALGKVDTVHYLGLIKIEDWKRKHLARQYQTKQLEKEGNELRIILKKKNIGEHVLQGSCRLPKDVLSKIYSDRHLPQNFYEQIEHYWNLQNLSFCQEHLSDWKDYIRVTMRHFTSNGNMSDTPAT